MQARITQAAALRELPEAWGLVLAAVGTHRRAWMTAAEIETPSREMKVAGLAGIDAGPCADMEAAGWLARWEVYDRGAVTEDERSSVDENAPPPGVVAWTLTPWAAEALGVELDEIGCDGAPPRWVEVRYDEAGDRVACDRPVVAPWHRWERLQPWIERLAEDRRKALMAAGPREVETLKDEESGAEIRLFAGPEGKGAGVAIVREMRKLTARGKGKAKARGKGKGRTNRRAAG